MVLDIIITESHTYTKLKARDEKKEDEMDGGESVGT